MKSTRAKYLVRNIKKGGVSFLAVAVIAAVSIAIFHGFQSSANAILQRADRYFTENNLETLEISCANGITPEDLQAIAAWESVDAVEGGYTDSVQLDTGGERILVQARSLTDTINQPVVVEGSLPTAENEAAIEAYLAQQEGIAVGDPITLAQDGCLTGDTFTVTGIVNLPVYCCVSLFDVRGTAEAGLGSNEYFVCLPQAAFDAAYYSDCYTTAYVDSSTLDGVYYFSDEYAAGEQDYLETLEPLAQERAQLRYDQLKGEVDTDLTDARQELQDALAAKVPLAPIHSMDQVLEDPQLNFRNMFIDYAYGSATGKMFGTPIKLSATPCDTSGPAPDMGQDNEKVYAEFLGYGVDKLAELSKKGVL